MSRATYQGLTNPTSRKSGWWERLPEAPQPDELVAHATIYSPDDIGLRTSEALDRVAEAYIAHCREIGHWAHMGGKVPFHADGERAYRRRLREYRGVQAYVLRQQAAARVTSAKAA